MWDLPGHSRYARVVERLRPRALLLSLAVAVTSRVALAQPLNPIDAGQFRLSWVAPSGCPQAEVAATRIHLLLGGGKVSASSQVLDVKAVLSELPSGEFRLDLELVENNQTRQRSVEAKTCAEVAEAGSLIVALALDPQLEKDSPREDSPRDSARPPVIGEIALQHPPPQPIGARPIVDARASPKQTTAHNRSHSQRYGRFGAGFAAVLERGSLPDWGLGAEVSLHGRWQAFRLELGGSWLPPRRELATGTATAGGFVQLLSVDTRGCWLLASHQRLDAAACLAFELGRRRAEGFGAVRNGSGNANWLAPGLGFLLSYRLRRALAWRTRFEGLIPLQRSEFIVENVGTLPAPRWAIRLSFGVDADFW